jgi:hypothetical protein
MKRFFETQTRSDRAFGLSILALAMLALFVGWSL